jgi:hypothetical protein
LSPFRAWKVRAVGAALLGIAIVAPPFADPAELLLLVEDSTRGRVLHRGLVTVGQTVVLSYVHSSEQVPVRGTFVVERDGALRVRETAFGGFGPGLPQPTAGEAWRLEDGMIVVPSNGEALSELRVRVAPFTGHRLDLGGGVSLDLSRLVEGGGSVLIRVVASGG